MVTLPADLAALLPADRTLIAAEALCGSGSARGYWRLRFASGPDMIGTIGTNRRENEAFIYLAEKLAEGGTPVPRVLAVSPDGMAYLQTCAGSRSLFDCLDRTDLIASAMTLLARAQQTPAIDYTRSFPVAAMDRRAIMWDLNYFKYCFLKTCPGIEIDEPALEDDFERLADIILAARPLGFMVRDFQSRNVMVDDSGALTLIDFQGGRLGPAHYDVASFLWQARAGFPDALRSEMVTRFCAARGIADEAGFRARLPYFIALRLLQALGAYGFRGRFERKEHFLLSIPPAIESLKRILPTLSEPLPAIESHISGMQAADGAR